MFLRRCLEKTYNRYAVQLFTCALAVTCRRDLAEDAVHDAFIRLLRLEEAPRSLKAYVFKSVRNAAIDLVRKEARTVATEEHRRFDWVSTPREEAECNEFKGQVSEALMTLSDNERETIVQHLYADLTFREIAELRETSVNTVASWYRRGVAKLRDEMKE
jgi:RNA polymerase sigma-70 factor (ECF subfamily)